MRRAAPLCSITRVTAAGGGTRSAPERIAVEIQHVIGKHELLPVRGKRIVAVGLEAVVADHRGV